MRSTGTRTARHPRKTARKAKVVKRQEQRATRNPKQQLDHLDKLLGKDTGAKKERTRLQKAIESVGKPVVAKVQDVVEKMIDAVLPSEEDEPKKKSKAGKTKRAKK